MLMPSIFGDSLFEDFMDFPFRRHASSNVMKTDVKDAGDHYELDIDMPGFDKKDIKAELKDGYMTISATTDKNMMKKIKTASISAANATMALAAGVSMLARM